eukprot:1348150-Amphidinium_carterae.2
MFVQKETSRLWKNLMHDEIAWPWSNADACVIEHRLKQRDRSKKRVPKNAARCQQTTKVVCIRALSSDDATEHTVSLEGDLTACWSP